MTEQIVRLSGGDFEAAMDFLNSVFGEHAPHDFEALLPSIYRRTDEHMACNYAIRRDGAIKAIVGMFPINWQVADATLRVAGIGGVATDPACRGQGLMQSLMRHCVTAMTQQGFHLSWLGGQRQRYLYFGYEKCGTSLYFTMNRANIRHGFDDEPGVRFTRIGQGEEALLRRAKELHDDQAMHCERPLQDFHRFCASWRHQLWAATNEAGEMVGYLVADKEGTYVPELMARTSGEALRMVRGWIAECGNPGVSIEMNPAHGFSRNLAKYCEQTSVRPSGNWQILQWAEVVDALMKVQRQWRAGLVDGKVIVGIEGYGAIALVVKDGEPRCAKTEEEPHVSGDSATCMRLLFGPLAPSQVLSLGPAAMLESWCPLPLYWSRQDGV
jgi:predicted N-acetyltransferase YhbS